MAYIVHTLDDLFAVRWLSAPDAAEHERLLRELETFAAGRGVPVVLLVCFPPDMGVPAPDAVAEMIAKMSRIERCVRCNLLIIDGHRAGSHRANLVILETMAQAVGHPQWVYFRTSAEAALVEFPPPGLGLDGRRAFAELRRHGICMR